MFDIEVIFFYSEKEIVLGVNFHEGLIDDLFVERALVDEKNEEGMYCNI